MEMIQEQNNIVKPVEYAGFWLRFGAHILDQILIGLFNFLLVFPFLMFTGLIAGWGSLAGMNFEELSEEETIGIGLGFMGMIMTIVIVSFFISWLYYSIMESSSRQATLGKLALDLKVTDMQGNRITFLNATGRYFGKIISGMTFSIGYLMAGFTTHKQALHDIIAGCLVVKK